MLLLSVEATEEARSLHRIFSVLLLCVSLFYGYTDAQWAIDDDGCRTPDRGVGTCITIHECPPILEIIEESPKPLSQRVVAYLRAYQCGVDGGVVKVCCPSGPIVNQLFGGLPDVKNHRNLNLLPLDKCGLDTDEDKIVGGNKTGVFEFPWMVLLSYRTEQGGLDFKCGGTIINYRYILTAAHCITNLDKLRLVGVRIGEHNVETPRDCDTHKDPVTGQEYKTCADPPQDIGIEETVHHPRYSSATFTNDIGLVRLSRRIDLEKMENVRAVCLPYDRRFMSYNYTGRFVTVTGWGATETGRASNELLKVSLAVLTNDDCNELYKATQKKITNKQMCAGGVGGKDSCGGDSGGPLMVKMQPSKYELRTFQQGVVSFGPKFCGITGLPGVYTRVAYYMDWILDNLKP